jgi:hypothetical protein
VQSTAVMRHDEGTISAVLTRQVAPGPLVRPTDVGLSHRDKPSYLSDHLSEWSLSAELTQGVATQVSSTLQ